MSTDDTIGVVHEHRWCKSAEQVKRLEDDGCRIIVSLGGGKAKQVTFDELVKLSRPGTVLKFVHVMFLADVRKKGAKVVRASYRAREKKLIEERGAILKDLDSGLTTEQPGHRKAILALTDDLIARHAQGAKSAAVSQARKGRPLLTFTADEMKDAKAVWRNVKDYPTWDDAAAALPEKFTVHRAHRLWGKRQ
jgi:hypothetical protein